MKTNKYIFCICLFIRFINASVPTPPIIQKCNIVENSEKEFLLDKLYTQSSLIRSMVSADLSMYLNKPDFAKKRRSAVAEALSDLKKLYLAGINTQNQPDLLDHFEKLITGKPPAISQQLKTCPLETLAILYPFCRHFQLTKPLLLKVRNSIIKKAAVAIYYNMPSFFMTNEGKQLKHCLKYHGFEKEKTDLPNPIPTQLRHKKFDKVKYIRFSPDGSKIVSVSDKRMKLWDATGSQCLSIRKIASYPSDIVFSPDSSKIAITWWHAFTEIWRITAKNDFEFMTRLRTGSTTRTMIFSPDSTKIIIAPSNDTHTVTLWDIKTSKELFKFRHKSDVNRVILSTDGSKIAVTTVLDYWTTIWDTTTGTLIAKLPHENYVDDVAFSPNDLQVATASRDHTAKLWDAKTGTFLFTFPHDKQVTCVNFSPNGSNIATQSSDKTIKLWKTKTGTLIPNNTITWDVKLRKYSKKLLRSITCNHDYSRAIRPTRRSRDKLWQLTQELDLPSAIITRVLSMLKKNNQSIDALAVNTTVLTFLKKLPKNIKTFYYNEKVIKDVKKFRDETTPLDETE